MWLTPKANDTASRYAEMRCGVMSVVAVGLVVRSMNQMMGVNPSANMAATLERMSDTARLCRSFRRDPQYWLKMWSDGKQISSEPVYNVAIFQKLPVGRTTPYGMANRTLERKSSTASRVRRWSCSIFFISRSLPASTHSMIRCGRMHALSSSADENGRTSATATAAIGPGAPASAEEGPGGMPAPSRKAAPPRN